LVTDYTEKITSPALGRCRPAIKLVKYVLNYAGYAVYVINDYNLFQLIKWTTRLWIRFVLIWPVLIPAIFLTYSEKRVFHTLYIPTHSSVCIEHRIPFGWKNNLRLESFKVFKNYIVVY